MIFFSFLVGLNWGNKAAIYNAGSALCSFEVEKVDMIGLWRALHSFLEWNRGEDSRRFNAGRSCRSFGRTKGTLLLVGSRSRSKQSGGKKTKTADGMTNLRFGQDLKFGNN